MALESVLCGLCNSRRVRLWSLSAAYMDTTGWREGHYPYVVPLRSLLAADVARKGKTYAETTECYSPGPGLLRDVRCRSQDDSGIQVEASAGHQAAGVATRAADYPAVGLQRVRDGVTCKFSGGAGFLGVLEK